jgi:hypothetical protein
LRIQDTKDKDDDSKDNAQTDLVQTDSINARNALNFTFRSDLPDDIVPTLNAVCARYYYSVVVFAKQTNGKVRIALLSELSKICRTYEIADFEFA